MALPPSPGRGAQERLGLPPGFKTYSPFPFAGMNQQSSRIGMEDNEFYWRENFMRIGPGRLRTLWDKGTPLYTATAPRSIISFFWFNIGQTDYCAVFLDNGTAVQVAKATGSVTVMSPAANTFYVAGSPFPACCQSGTQYLLIANNITPNSYWIWDGTVLYSAGGAGPTVTLRSGGVGYSSAPTAIFFGGSGSGMAGTPVVTNGSVTSVLMTNPGSGYSPGDVVQIAFSGGGSDTTPILTAVLTATTVDHINLLDGGRGYVSPVVAITGGGGAGATATATQSGGVISSITITNHGTGFTGVPTVSITDSAGPGAGAQASAILVPTSVASVTVVDGGAGFNTAPTLTFVGGGGSLAAATASLTAKAISSVSVGTAGSGYTSVPAVEVQVGINSSAYGTVELMPFGVSGSSIETFVSRVFLPYPNQQTGQQNGGSFLVSAPGSLTDFAISSGGVIFNNTDRFLRKQYVNLRQSNGYLYLIGDSSCSVVSNVQSSGTPTTTTFNYQNADPQVGITWRDTLQDFGRSMLFGNSTGVYGLYGGGVSKISGKLEQLFNTAIFPPTTGALTPSGAVMHLFNIKTYLMLMTIHDPLLDENRNVMVAWDEHDWFVVSQTVALTYIGTQEVDSKLSAWGTDGTSLYPLLSAPSNALNKKIATKLYGAANMYIVKEATAVFLQGDDHSAAKGGFSVNVTVENEQGDKFPLPTGALTINSPTPNSVTVGAASGDVYGTDLGLTLTSNSEDFGLYHLVLGYLEKTSLFRA